MAATTVWGVVKDGCIVPSRALPEGAHVEIRLVAPVSDPAEDMQAEFEAWDRASANTLELVESLARQSETDETR